MAQVWDQVSVLNCACILCTEYHFRLAVHNTTDMGRRYSFLGYEAGATEGVKFGPISTSPRILHRLLGIPARPAARRSSVRFCVNWISPPAANSHYKINSRDAIAAAAAFSSSSSVVLRSGWMPAGTTTTTPRGRQKSHVFGTNSK